MTNDNLSDRINAHRETVVKGGSVLSHYLTNNSSYPQLEKTLEDALQQQDTCQATITLSMMEACVKQGKSLGFYQGVEPGTLDVL